MMRRFHPDVIFQQRTAGHTSFSGGSRISRCGGAPTCWGGGGADLRCIHFSVKMYAKTREIDPVGGGGVHAGGTPWIRQCHCLFKIVKSSGHSIC